MRVIIGGVWQNMLEGSSVSIKRAMSDPVPTCSLSLRDNDSSIQINAMDEVLVLDEQMIPNPTINLLQNPDLNPYTTDWFIGSPVTGTALSQVVGGGIKYTFTNAANGSSIAFYQFVPVGNIVPGQDYTASFYAQATSPVGFNIQGYVAVVDQAQNVIGSYFFSTVSPPTSLTRYSLSFTAPAGTSFANITIFPQTTSGTNSGTVSFTQIQFEPAWFLAQSYPSAFCGPSQTNCVQLPGNLLWIRQYRKFGGFVNHVVAGDYHGNVRTLQIDAVGYAWLMGLVLSNKTYTSKTDAFIMEDMVSTYFSNSGNGTSLFNTDNVLTGITLSSVQSNWDDIRTNYDNLAAQSGFFWTVDPYWNLVYEPPGYTTMPISLICDDSTTINETDTYPAYDFSAEMDFTQPGAQILVIGNGSSVALVQDPNTIANTQNITLYGNGNGGIFTRKVNEAGLASNTDCVNRGIAEILQYDYPRYMYHLTTNVELVAGEGVPVTSDTDGLSNTVLLIQQISANWLGTDETLTDVWEYRADLGTINRAASQILSHIFRTANQNTSAPAIATTALMLVERFGILDQTPTTGSASLTLYQATILNDSPLAYYPLSEFAGTIADDLSGHANQGTITGVGVTYRVSGPIDDNPNAAMTFNGTTGEITSTISGSPTGAAAWSLEGWIKYSATGGNPNLLVTLGTWGTNQLSVFIGLDATGHALIATFGSNHSGASVLSTGAWHQLVGTYDGTTMKLYVDGNTTPVVSVADTVNLTGSSFAIASATGAIHNQLNGSAASVAIYNYALTSTQVANHYTIATT